MAKVTGVVSKHEQNKFGGFSIVVNGNYYNSKFEIKCKVGDAVEFDDGGKNYCSKLKVVAAGATASSAGTGATKAHSGRDTSIVRQNALRHATQAVCNAVGMAGEASDVEYVERIIAMARQFEDYVNAPDVSAPNTSSDFIEAA